MLCRYLYDEYAHKMNVEIISGVISKDNAHILMSPIPSVSVSKLVKFSKRQNLKKTSARITASENDIGVNTYRREVTLSYNRDVSIEMIKEYIEHHFENKDELTDDLFRIGL